MEDINEIVNRVAQELDSDRRRIMIENYINRVVARIQSATPVELVIFDPDPQVAGEIKAWTDNNKTIFGYKVAEAARIILRQELLGE